MDKGKGRARDDEEYRLARGDTLCSLVAWSSATGLVAAPSLDASGLIQQIRISLPSSSPSLTLNLPLPVHDPPLLVSRLSFSPDGALLVAIAASTNNLQGIHVILYQMQDALDLWSPILDWNSDNARYAGPTIHNVCDMRWMGDTDYDHRGKPDYLSQFSGAGFLAILDTQECLFFHLPETGAAPFIGITALSKAFTSADDLFLPGINPSSSSVQADVIDPQSGLLTGASATASSSRTFQPSRIIEHASISSFDSGSIQNTFRALIAYKSRKVLQHTVHSFSATAAGTTDLGLPPPSAGSGLADAIPPTTTQQVLENASIAIQEQQAPLASRMFEDPYGEVAISALDDLFDFDNDNSSSNNFDSNTFGADSFNDMMQDEEKNNSKAHDSGNSPTKSGSATSSPKKAHSILPGGGTQVGETIPELLLQQLLEEDEERAALQIWEISACWSPMSLASQPHQYLPLFDPLNPTSFSTSSPITSLQFLHSHSPASQGSHTLCACTADGVLRSWALERTSFVLSDAFANLEGRKADPGNVSMTEMVEVSVRQEVVKALFEQGEEGEEDEKMDEEMKNKERKLVVGIMQAARDSLVLAVKSFGNKDGNTTLRSIDSQTFEDIPGLSSRSIPGSHHLSLTSSPNGTLVLALPVSADNLRTPLSKPAIFPLPSPLEESAVIESLGRKLASALAARHSYGDIRILALTKPIDFRLQVLSAAWKNASGSMRGTIHVGQSRMLLPFLAVQKQFFKDDSPSQAKLADDLLQLIACQRILQESKTTIRSSVQNVQNPQQQVLDVFEPSSVWPVIGYVTWLFRLWDRIIGDILGDVYKQDWSSATFLLIHPLPRLIQQRLIRLVARFANYVMGVKELPPQSAFAGTVPGGHDLEIVRALFSDLIYTHRAKTQEWSALLHGLQAKMEGRLSAEGEGQDPAAQSLATLRLPEDLQDVAKETQDLIRQKLAVTVVVQSKKRNRDYDIITKGEVMQRAPNGKRCTGCRGQWRGTHQNEVNVSDWEASKSRSCICGHHWVTDSV